LSDTENRHEDLHIPATMPMLPVRDVVIYPYMILPLFVGREGSIKAVDDALAKVGNDASSMVFVY